MALEAQMEEWSADPQASWLQEKAQTDRGRAEPPRCRGVDDTPDVRRPEVEEGRSMLLTSPSMEGRRSPAAGASRWSCAPSARPPGPARCPPCPCRPRRPGAETPPGRQPRRPTRLLPGL